MNFLVLPKDGGYTLLDKIMAITFWGKDVNNLKDRVRKDNEFNLVVLKKWRILDNAARNKNLGRKTYSEDL